MIKRFSLVFFLVFLILGWQAYQVLVKNHAQTIDYLWLIPFTAEQAKVLNTNNSYTPKQIALADKLSQSKFELGDNIAAKPETSHLTPTLPVNLNSLSLTQLWRQWETRLNQSEHQQIPIISALLAESMHKQADPVVYQNIAQIFEQPDVPLVNKVVALDLLSDLATPKSLNLLIDLAKKSTNSPLFFFVLQAISRIGDNRWDGIFHEELSPLLEKVWLDPEIDDKAFISAIGQALSAIGAAQGVETLLSTLSAGNITPVINPVSRIKQEVALEVIPQISNPDAVEVLTRRLELEHLDSTVLEVTGSALAGISTPEATEKLINWATQASAENARTLESWLPKINDAESIAMIINLQSQAFQSSEIQGIFSAYAATDAAVNLRTEVAITPIEEKKD